MEEKPKRRWRVPWLLVGLVCGAAFGRYDALSVRDDMVPYYLWPFTGAIYGTLAGLLLDLVLAAERRYRARRATH